MKKSLIGLTIGALGVVFGDIGTSPLYALSVIFGKTGHYLPLNNINVFGVISLVIWSVTLVVSIKFVYFIMRADNEGEGGIMALVARIKSSKLSSNYKWGLIILGIIGVGLFFGDSTITPAISVLSAVEGLNVVAPGLSNLIVPITVSIITLLFVIQKYGTGIIGKLFGPVMLIWFITIAIGGLVQIIHNPDILIALSPTTALHFFLFKPLFAFVAMGAVILAITGVEALYADMGHFGRLPITRAWLFIVFPALILCYMGEGTLILHNSSTSTNPLVFMFPLILRFPIVILATIATIIASQSVISGAFSLTRQAIQLDFLPKMLVRHTSTLEGGQIYLPFINTTLFVIVSVLVITFGSSARLANAYGIAVSGTLAIDTILYIVILRSVWRRPLSNIIAAIVIFIPIDLLFVSSSAPKIFKGGWFPILVGILIFIIMSTWLKGKKIETKTRQSMEISLQKFADKIRTHKPAISRIPGTSIFIGHHHNLTPLALITTLEDMHELPDKVVVVSIEVTTAAHIPEAKRALVDALSYYNDGISHISLSYGFYDQINIPEALKKIKENNNEPDFDLDIDSANYIISSSKLLPNKRHNLAIWRKRLYIFMSRNALSSSNYYKLPTKRTEELQTLIEL